MTRRRTLLALAGATLAGLAGCATDSGSDPANGTPDATPTETPDGTAGDESGEGNEGAEETSNGTASGLSAEVALSKKAYAVHASPVDQLPDWVLDPVEPTPVSEFTEPLADAIRQARDGGFETDEVSDELLTAVDIARPRPYRSMSELHVRINGTAYVADLQLPELEVRLGEEEVEEYDPDRVATEDDEFDTDSVRRLMSLIAWDGTPETARTTYRKANVPKAVESFLDSYDYVEDHEGVSPIVVERHNWEPPYSIELREFTAADRWDREILDAQALDGNLRALLEDVVASGEQLRSPSYVTDEVPETYEDTLRPDGERADKPLLRLDGTVYYVRVAEGSHESMPVTATAEPAATTDDGLAQFRLRVEVTDEKPDATVPPGEPVELHSEIGLPCALWVTRDGEQHLIDSDRYEVPVQNGDDGRSWTLAVDDLDIRETSVKEELSVGDDLTATYVVPGTVPAGSYSLAGEFAALWQANPDDHNKHSGVYPFEVELTLTES